MLEKFAVDRIQKAAFIRMCRLTWNAVNGATLYAQGKNG